MIISNNANELNAALFDLLNSVRKLSSSSIVSPVPVSRHAATQQA
jgi:hypothetical protein